MTGALACVAKVTLGILNTLFLLIGLALLVAGALIKTGADVIGDVLSELKNVPAVSQYLDTAAWILIGLGIFFTAMGILGGCGACCSIKVFLILYAVIVIVLIVAQAVFLALFFSDKLKEILRPALKDSFAKYKPPPDPTSASQTIDTSDALSRGLDALFLGLKCCGFDSYKDLGVTNAPITCCEVFTPDLLKSSNPYAALADLKDCVDHGVKSYKDKGCYSAILDLIEDNKPMAIGIIVAIFVFQIICVVFAILIVKDKMKNAVSPMD